MTGVVIYKSCPVSSLRTAAFRVWRSLVSRLNGVQEALSSNLSTRTSSSQATIACDEFFHFIVKLIVRSFCRSPLSQKVTLGSPARLQAPSQRLAVAANFLRGNALRATFFRHRKNIDFDRPYANNDNPNYIIQVGNVFGFIISIENIF